MRADWIILQLSLCYCILNRFLVHIETDDIQDLVTSLLIRTDFCFTFLLIDNCRVISKTEFTQPLKLIRKLQVGDNKR